MTWVARGAGISGGEVTMFEVQYNDEMEAEVKRLEAQQRAVAAGHPEWVNACAACGCELKLVDFDRCERCSSGRSGAGKNGPATR
jgi:hypothetical protein